MDIITQGIAGALIAQTAAKPKYTRQATLIGFVAGILPDADALIHSASDPLLTLEFHRQFSHSLLFIPVGAFIAALFLLPFLRKKIPVYLLYVFCLLGYSSAGLLDACTSYGTQLLWPFSDERIAWNLIAIVDPIFSLALLAMLITGWRSRNRRFASYGLAFAGVYLLLALSQQQTASSFQHALASHRGHVAERSVIKPTLGNILLWRSIYQYDGRYYIDAIRVSLTGETRLYTGKSIAVYIVDQRTQELARAFPVYQDVMRFEKLSKGFLVKHPLDENVIGDIRYAMLPNSAEPLWGVRINPDKEHATEALFRKNDSKTRQIFLQMVKGN